METHWKKSDEKSTLLVFGYLRSIEKSLISVRLNIPLALKCYCLSYYFLNDYFTIHGDNIIVNESGTIAQGNKSLFSRNTVYGNELIELNVNHRHYQWKWKFRLSQINPDTPGFWIGIDSSNKNKVNCTYSIYDDTYFFYGLTNKGRIVRSGSYPVKMLESKKKWGQETMIDMRIQFTTLKCTEMADSEGWWLIFRDISQDMEESWVSIKESKYHLAIVMSEKGQKIELLKYKFINNNNNN